ncbi:QueT transporter family protein [Anaeromassilibacillus senegalensis]|uniref:QueT transporter family protein n=1 Tax=Anaeromassilibacillus senegalensis TaxID=1673717 RepID=A0ABS9CP20_9FIRM|nr:QueT transporter family protein [Anaeromassilibacillus senegalensis]
MRILYVRRTACAAVSRDILTLKNTSAAGFCPDRGTEGNASQLKTTNKVRFLALSAVIAALYAVLTYAAAAMNLAYGPFQFRFSEALTVLPAFTPAAIPGLTIGCLLSNLASPLGIVDWVFGTLATLLASLCTYMLRNIRWKEIPILAPLPPVLFNALIVGLEIACLSEAGSFGWGNASLAGFVSGAVSVGVGELVVCFALGIPLMIAIKRTKLSQFMLV